MCILVDYLFYFCCAWFLVTLGFAVDIIIDRREAHLIKDIKEAMKMRG
jgi:hypothetical protein